MEQPIKRAVVLGAGASCSYADSPTGQRPPLANQIIPTYFNLDISENRFVLVGNIVNYVQKTKGIRHEEFPSWTDDIERFLTEIDEAIVTLAPKLKGRKLREDEFQRMTLSQGTYNQLIFLFGSILNEIQNGPVSIPYALLANELKDDDTCITFNWDTLLDRALASTGKWSPVNGYAIAPEAIFDDGWQSIENFASTTGGPQFLKLHGSTNWLTPYYIINLSTGERRTLSGYAINKLFIFIKATTPYQTYENRYWGPYEPFSYCYYPPDLPCQRDDTPPGYVSYRAICAPDLPEHAKFYVDDKSVYSMPLIVPPVKDKQYLRYGEIFSVLWEKASKALSECEELYVIGYSLPPTDHVAKDLFREALKKNANLKSIIIWNPSPSNLEELFINDFGINKLKLRIKAERFDPLKSPTSKILSVN
jgi:hypothetical protein